MRDGMLFAEIALYSMLEQTCSRKSYMKLDGSHGGFEEWRHKWSYLLGQLRPNFAGADYALNPANFFSSQTFRHLGDSESVTESPILSWHDNRSTIPLESRTMSLFDTTTTIEADRTQ